MSEEEKKVEAAQAEAEAASNAEATEEAPAEA